MSATLLSTKDLLLQYDFTKPIDDKGKVVRGTAHEFQDYAYRLANDLNDVAHLHIYMKLAKTVPRFIFEKTYEFVADANTQEKAKLFMWKFKQVRQMYQREIDMRNYSHDFVKSKMKILRNQVAQKIIEKNDANTSFIEFIEQISFQNKPNNALILENSSTLLPSLLSAKQVIGIDDSSQLTTRLKNHYKGIKQLKFITKQFLKHSFKPESFDTIIMPKLWTWIPIESELDYLTEMHNLTKKDGFIVVGTKISDANKQGWKIFSEATGDIYFEKLNEKTLVERQFIQNGFAIVNILESGEFTYYVIKKL